jgi:hypothetical protein
MKDRLLPLAVLLSCNLGSLAAQESRKQEPVTFIACPIYRDTNSGRKSGCWLADEPSSGVRFDIGGGRLKPQIGHEPLVEGVRATGSSDEACGGVVLVPVHVAVLETRCSSVMLPAEGYKGRVYHIPVNAVLPPADSPLPLPPPPYKARQWIIEFGFRSDFLAYQYSEVILDEIGRYIAASHPKRVRVTGYAATHDYVVQGRHFTEPAPLAQARANMVAEALRRLGAGSAALEVNSNTNPAPLHSDTDLAEPSKRRVTVDVEF